MGKPRDLVYPTSPSRDATVTPLYVCPGVHDEPLPYAIFPLGDGWTKPRNCPLRDCCLWYAGHDLGGTTSLDDFPAESIYPARFRIAPFHCADYKSAGQSARTVSPQDDDKEAKPPENTLIVAQFKGIAAGGGTSPGH